MVSDIPERIYVDPHSPELDWCYDPLEETFTEYIRADKYAELEAKNKRLVELIREFMVQEESDMCDVNDLTDARQKLYKALDSMEEDGAV